MISFVPTQHESNPQGLDDLINLYDKEYAHYKRTILTNECHNGYTITCLALRYKHSDAVAMYLVGVQDIHTPSFCVVYRGDTYSNMRYALGVLKSNLTTHARSSAVVYIRCVYRGCISESDKIAQEAALQAEWEARHTQEDEQEDGVKQQEYKHTLSKTITLLLACAAVCIVAFLIGYIIGVETIEPMPMDREPTAQELIEEIHRMNKDK